MWKKFLLSNFSWNQLFQIIAISNQLFVYNLTQVFEEIDASKSMELGGKNENASSAFDAMVGTVYV